MVAREVRDRESSDATEEPDFGDSGEPVTPGPIVGAEEAPEGGAEAAEAAEPEESGSGPKEPEEAPEGGAEAAEAAEPEEAGEEAPEGGASTRPERAYRLGIVPRRGPFPKATTAEGYTYTYSVAKSVDPAKEEERERTNRERAEKRAEEGAKGKGENGKKGKKGPDAKGKAEEWLAENLNRRWRSAE